MALYSTGTVTVTNGSTTVTGSGTAWFGTLQAGWMFVGPNGLPIGIEDVVSNTMITLTRPYQGATASAQDYEAFPTMSLAGNLATAFQGIASNFQGIIDGPGQGKFSNGTVAAPGVRFEADPDTGLRRAGANDIALVAGGADKLRANGNTASGDIVQSSATDDTAGRLLKVGAFGLGSGVATLISNIDTHQTSGFYYGFGGAHVNATPGTNPFPTLNGAFGVTCGTSAVGGDDEYLWQIAMDFSVAGRISYRAKASNASGWASWAELTGQRNMVGTVSQSGGEPTGAVIERGSNSNGEFVRFADGTQICSHELAGSNSSGVTWNFPAAFAAVPFFSGQPVSANAARIVTVSATTANSGVFHVWLDNGARGTATVKLFAFGRWF